MADFRTVSEERGRIEALTIDVALSGKTLYLGDKAVSIGGNDYEPVIKGMGDLQHSSGGAAGVSKVSDFEFTVFNNKLNFQAAGKRFAHITKDYLLVGATVTVKENVRDAATMGAWYSKTVLIGEVQEILVGEMETVFRVESIQEYDRIVPPTLFRKDDAGMERLPGETEGTPIPIIFGDFSNAPSDASIFAAADTYKLEHCGIVRNAVPLLLYDRMDPTNYFHNYRACSHAAKELDLAYADEVFVYDRQMDAFISFVDMVAAFDNAAGYVDVKLNKTGSAYIRLKGFKYKLGPSDWQKASDLDEDTFAIVQYGSANALELYMDACTDLGEIVATKICVIVQTTVASDQPLYLGYATTGAPTWVVINAGGLMTSPAFYEIATSPASFTWDLTDGSGNALWIGCGFPVGSPTSGVVNVHEIALEIEYRPTFRAGSKRGSGKQERHLW